MIDLTHTESGSGHDTTETEIDARIAEARNRVEQSRLELNNYLHESKDASPAQRAEGIAGLFQTLSHALGAFFRSLFGVSDIAAEQRSARIELAEQKLHMAEGDLQQMQTIKTWLDAAHASLQRDLNELRSGQAHDADSQRRLDTHLQGYEARIGDLQRIIDGLHQEIAQLPPPVPKPTPASDLSVTPTVPSSDGVTGSDDSDDPVTPAPPSDSSDDFQDSFTDSGGAPVAPRPGSGGDPSSNDGSGGDPHDPASSSGGDPVEPHPGSGGDPDDPGSGGDPNDPASGSGGDPHGPASGGDPVEPRPGSGGDPGSNAGSGGDPADPSGSGGDPVEPHPGSGGDPDDPGSGGDPVEPRPGSGGDPRNEIAEAGSLLEAGDQAEQDAPYLYKQEGNNFLHEGGTCGICAPMMILNRFAGQAGEFSENELLHEAVDKGYYVMGPEGSLGTNPGKIEALLRDHGLEAESGHSDFAHLIDALADHKQAILDVNAGVLWNDTTAYGDGGGNHVIWVSGVTVPAGATPDAEHNLPSSGYTFIVNDSGSGEQKEISLADLEKAWKASGNFAVYTELPPQPPPWNPQEQHYTPQSDAGTAPEDASGTTETPTPPDSTDETSPAPSADSVPASSPDDAATPTPATDGTEAATPAAESDATPPANDSATPTANDGASPEADNNATPSPGNGASPAPEAANGTGPSADDLPDNAGDTPAPNPDANASAAGSQP
jgi:hypothetical protein